MHSHLLAAALHSNPTLKHVLITVVVGKAMVVAAKLEPHVIALAVPLSKKRNSNKSPSLGVPERFVVIDVIAVSKPVKFIISTLSVLVVGVAPGALVVVIRLITLLFVNVLVELVVGTTIPSTASTPAASLDKVISVAPPDPSSIVVNDHTPPVVIAGVAP